MNISKLLKNDKYIVSSAIIIALIFSVFQFEREKGSGTFSGNS